jgi:hypothetical protein
METTQSVMKLQGVSIEEVINTALGSQYYY